MNSKENAAEIANSRRELACPVCLEEFHEPKILPACRHSVCKLCLEKIVDRIVPSTIQCPVCRGESILEDPEVTQLETNVKLVGELKKMNLEKEKDEICRNIESAVARVTSLEKLLGDFDAVKKRRMENADKAKNEVKLATSRLINAIQRNESVLCTQLESEKKRQLDLFDARRSEVEALLARTRSFVSAAKGALERDEISEFKHWNLAEGDLVQKRSHEELICYASMEIQFNSNEALMVKLGEAGLGSISVRDYAAAKVAFYNGSVPLSPIPRPVEVLRTITPPELGFESFSPLTIAADGKNRLAVSDPSNNNVLLFDRQGSLVRRILSPTAIPMLFSGVAFGKDKTTLIAVNAGRDVHYINVEEGTFQVTYKGNPTSDLKYCFLTTDTDGRILLTCEPATKNSRPCVVVYSDKPFGKPDLTFGHGSGEGSLLFPFKAWRLEDEYFVADMEKGCVMVYDLEGVFRRHFGGKEAKIDAPGIPGRLMLPTGMAPHPDNNTIFVCDWGSSTVQIYTRDGAFTDVFPVGGRPTDIAIFDDGTIFVSSKDDQWIKILSV